MLRMPDNKDKQNMYIDFPVPLSKSRDYNAIEILFYTVFNYFYVLSKESKNVHNPFRCNVKLLPLLADYYRYEYTDVQDVDFEREIIATVPNLHHNKGTSTGIDNAIRLSIYNKKDPTFLPWFYVNKNGENIIQVIVYNNFKTYKLYELLKLVTPLGTKIEFIAGRYIQISEEVNMHSWTKINFGALTPDKAHYVQPNNYWHTEWDSKTQAYSVYVDEQWELGNPENAYPEQDGIEIKDNGEIVYDSENKQYNISGATRINEMNVASNEEEYQDNKIPRNEDNNNA